MRRPAPTTVPISEDFSVCDLCSPQVFANIYPYYAHLRDQQISPVRLVRA